MTLSPLDRWLLVTLAGGGVLLLGVYLLARQIQQPARRLRWAESGVIAALFMSLAGLAPAWLIVSFPSASSPQQAPVPPAQIAAPEIDPAEFPAEPLLFAWPEENVFIESPPPAAVLAESPAPAVEEPRRDILAWLGPALLLAYALGAGFFLTRWLLGIVGLWRILARCEPAANWVQNLAREHLAGVRVVCSPSVEVPFSCGILRPTIVLPAGLPECATGEELAWVLAHESAHLRRGDPRGLWLLSLAAALFYPFPWFWSLRASWRLDQEYLADAEAVQHGPRVEYAEFLLQWTARPQARRVPAVAVGVLGRSSDLFRRITMLLRGNTSLESRCPRLWSAVVAPTLLAFAVVAAGVGFRADAAPVADPEKQEAPRKEEPKAVPAVPGFPQFPEFPDLDNLLPPDLPLAPEQFKQLQEEMKRAREQARKAMEEFRQPGRFGVFGMANRSEARLGAQVTKPSETLVDQLDLPMNQGLVLSRVEENSAAAKAGLKSHDVLLQLAGKPVSDNPADLVAQLKEIKANEAIEAIVLRKGKKETIKNLILPEAKVARPLGVVPFPFKNPFQGLPGNADGTILSVIRNGNTFTTNCTENGVTMQLTGTIADGNGTLTGATITENGTTTKYDSLDKVPEAHQARVKELVKMSATGQVKVDR